MSSATRLESFLRPQTLDSFRYAHPPNTLTHVMYHAKCHDGIAAAWVSLLFAKTMGFVAPILVPVRASSTWFELVDACPDLLDPSEPKHLLFVDVAPTMHIVHELRSKGISFGVLDHHKSNARDLPIVEAFYDLDRSGCILAYFYFFGRVRDDAIPWILLYIEDKDLFHWKRGRESFLFHLTWTANVLPDEDHMLPLLTYLTTKRKESEELRQSYVRQGYAIQTLIYAEANYVVYNGSIHRVAFDKNAPPSLVLCANFTSNLLHDVAHELARRSYDLVIFWRRSKRTGLVHSTLVTTQGRNLDVSKLSSELAASVGGTGGGHELAAGMQTSVEPDYLLEKLLHSRASCK